MATKKTKPEKARKPPKNLYIAQRVVAAMLNHGAFTVTVTRAPTGEALGVHGRIALTQTASFFVKPNGDVALEHASRSRVFANAVCDTLGVEPDGEEG